MKVERVITERAELYCERRGAGPLLLLIAGGLGDAGVYSAAADILADEGNRAQPLHRISSSHWQTTSSFSSGRSTGLSVSIPLILSVFATTRFAWP